MARLTQGSMAAVQAMETWLLHLGAIRNASPKTIDAYRADVSSFLGFLVEHWGGEAGLGPLSRVGVTDMRAWMAREKQEGLGARSLARRLSAVKSFYRWLGTSLWVRLADFGSLEPANVGFSSQGHAQNQRKGREGTPCSCPSDRERGG